MKVTICKYLLDTGECARRGGKLPKCETSNCKYKQNKKGGRE